MTLALHGGRPVRQSPFPPRPPYGTAERNAANEVVATGQLSGFLAEPGEAFCGGPRVLSLERAVCERFGVKYAVAMNSGTSCLFGAVQAVTSPRDEVIVSPWSMSASATCVLEADCVPVFADVEPETYCLDPESVRKLITPRTKAVVYVDLFGCVGASFDELRGVADEYGLTVVEDAAQAMGALFWYPVKGNPTGGIAYAGALGEVGVYSLNRHKTLQCGEGGVAVTDLLDVADFLRGYRNHGEVVDYRQGCWGGNYRMGEVEAAIAEVQLGRLEELTDPRWHHAERISEALGEYEGLVTPCRPPSQRHVYYLYALRVTGVAARRFAAALSAEGISASTYVEPLYYLPYLEKALWGTGRALLHPVVERCYREVVVLPHVHAGMRDEDVDDVVAAIKKVWVRRGEL